MPKVSETYSSNSQWLKASDFDGKDVKLKIESVGVATVDNDGKEQEKLEVAFEGTEKALLCNVTNARTFADVLGDDTDDWVGHEVILYSATVQGPQGLTQGIRVKSFPGQEAKSEVTDEIPF